VSTRNSPTVWSTAKDIWLNGPIVGLRGYVSTPEDRLRDTRFSIVLYVSIALVAIERVLRSARHNLWGLSLALGILFVIWIFWPLVKKLAIAIGPPRA
jgi:hypothetical protein